jgi:hypothetical protein
MRKVKLFLFISAFICLLKADLDAKASLIFHRVERIDKRFEEDIFNGFMFYKISAEKEKITGTCYFPE